MRGIHSCLLGVAWAALFFGLLPACGPTDECSMAKAHCDGDVAMRCQSMETGNGTAYRWQGESCSANSCKVSSTGIAFCSAGPDPDPRCSGTRDVICDGNTMRDCVEGYATAPGTVCAFCSEYDPDPSLHRYAAGALCLSEAARNPNCPNTPDLSSACDANDLLQCEAGFATMRQPCGTGFCVGLEECALSKDPDPNCVLTDSEMAFCEGNTAVQCAYGYRVSESPCPAGEFCNPMAVDCSNGSDTSCTLALCSTR